MCNTRSHFNPSKFRQCKARVRSRYRTQGCLFLFAFFHIQCNLRSPFLSKEKESFPGKRHGTWNLIFYLNYLIISGIWNLQIDYKGLLKIYIRMDINIYNAGITRACFTFATRRKMRIRRRKSFFHHSRIFQVFVPLPRHLQAFFASLNVVCYLRTIKSERSGTDSTGLRNFNNFRTLDIMLMVASETETL